MSTDLPGEEEPFQRPFLTGMLGSTHPSAGVLSGDDGGAPAEGDHETARPYFLTGGRVHESVSGFETVYSLTDGGHSKVKDLSFERREIGDLILQSPQSVAEISALLHIPLGVACVLVRDLVTDGLLDATVTVGDSFNDPKLIMRLIHAVHAL